MTIYPTYDTIKALREIRKGINPECQAQLDIAIICTSKQISRKVVWVKDEITAGLADTYAVCPYCEEEFEEDFSKHEYTFCYSCGQSLDWSKELDD